MRHVGAIYYCPYEEEYSVLLFTGGDSAKLTSDIAAIHDENPRIRELGEKARLLNLPG